MLLPTEPGSVPYLAVIGAKDGRLFLLDRNNLGGLQTGGLDTTPARTMLVRTVIFHGLRCESIAS